MEAGGEDGHQGEEPSQSHSVQGTRLRNAHPSTAHTRGHSQPPSLQASAVEGYGVRDTLWTNLASWVFWTNLNTTSFPKDHAVVPVTNGFFSSGQG